MSLSHNSLCNEASMVFMSVLKPRSAPILGSCYVFPFSPTYPHLFFHTFTSHQFWGVTQSGYHRKNQEASEDLVRPRERTGIEVLRGKGKKWLFSLDTSSSVLAEFLVRPFIIPMVTRITVMIVGTSYLFNLLSSSTYTRQRGRETDCPILNESFPLMMYKATGDLCLSVALLLWYSNVAPRQPGQCWQGAVFINFHYLFQLFDPKMRLWKLQTVSRSFIFILGPGETSQLPTIFF